MDSHSPRVHVSNAEECVCEDIIYNIIARLPLKSLLRFKCVSKHWNRVISDPSFIKFRSRPMIFLPISPFRIINIKDRSVIKLKSPAGLRPSGSVDIVGAVNGIVLINQDEIDYMILYNPFTTAFKRVPDTPLRDIDSELYVYGFGYGTTPNDIKIVRLNDDYGRLKSISCDVFSLGSWSTLAFFMGDYSYIELEYLDHGVFVNGFLYWMAFGDSRPMVVALDLVDMVFSHIQLPPNYNFSRDSPQRPLRSPCLPLFTLNGRLCMICNEGNNSYENELWVLNEVKSWLKVHPLPTLRKVLDHHFTWDSCIMNEGKFVLLKWSNSKESVFIYDFLKDSYEEIYDARALTRLNRRFRSQAAIEYVETLVSPSHMCSGFL